MMSTKELYGQLIGKITALPGVLAIGKTGGSELPQAGESDVDIFIICDAIPKSETRKAAYQAVMDARLDMDVIDSVWWGHGDFVYFGDMEICLMYFTVADMEEKVDAILAGRWLGKDGGYFYPIGRLATLLNMHSLHDPTKWLEQMQARLRTYPDPLAEKIIQHHIHALRDAEDFTRAVSRQEVLFFHSALENAIDHFLQALFALNRCYFPSRKRTEAYIATFAKKPDHCTDRLLQVVRLGAQPERLVEAYEVWQSLVRNLKVLSELD